MIRISFTSHLQPWRCPWFAGGMPRHGNVQGYILVLAHGMAPALPLQNSRSGADGCSIVKRDMSLMLVDVVDVKDVLLLSWSLPCRASLQPPGFPVFLVQRHPLRPCSDRLGLLPARRYGRTLLSNSGVRQTCDPGYCTSEPQSIGETVQYCDTSDG